MKVKRKKNNIRLILFLRFFRMLFGEIAAAAFIALVAEPPNGFLLLTIRVIVFILVAGLHILFDKILYE